MLQDREWLAREAVRKGKKNAASLFTKESSQQFYRWHMERQSTEKLVELARAGDKDAAEILRALITNSPRYRQLVDSLCSLAALDSDYTLLQNLKTEAEQGLVELRLWSENSRGVSVGPGTVTATMPRRG